MAYKLLTLYRSVGGVATGEAFFAQKAQAFKAFNHASNNGQTIIEVILYVSGRERGQWKSVAKWNSYRNEREGLPF